MLLPDTLTPLLGFAGAVLFPGVDTDDDPAAADDVADAPELVTEPAEEEALTEVDAADVMGDEVLTARLPIDVRVVQEEDEGMGCAEGVEGWPWKNVEEP